VGALRDDTGAGGLTGFSVTPSPASPPMSGEARVARCRLRRLLGALCAALLVVLVGGLALVVVANLVGYRSMIVRSGSMGETVPVGSLVLTEPVPRESIDIGDIAVVQPDGPDSARLHRVIEVYGGDDDVIVATQGDANEVADSGLTTLAPSVHVRRFSVPLLGYLLSASGSTAGLLASATMVAAASGWWMLRAIWRPADGPVTGRVEHASH